MSLFLCYYFNRRLIFINVRTYVIREDVKHNRPIPDVDYCGGDVETYVDKLELEYRNNHSKDDNNE